MTKKRAPAQVSKIIFKLERMFVFDQYNAFRNLYNPVFIVIAMHMAEHKWWVTQS